MERIDPRVSVDDGTAGDDAEPDAVSPAEAVDEIAPDTPPVGADFGPWQPPETDLGTALVLAGGGVTGIAWESGIVLGLRDEGVDVRDADTVIGTSAGAMVGAHLRLGTDDEAFARMRDSGPITDVGRLGPADAGRYLRAQLTRDARGGRALVGRAALTATTTTEEAWLETVGFGLVGKEWPRRRLLITGVDAETGTSVVFDGSRGVALDRAVAASCAVPGVFPAVEVAGRRYVDGGLRSIANADLAAGHERVLVLAPYPVGAKVEELPRVQTWALRRGARSHLVVPDARDAWAMGANPLDTTRAETTLERAREHGRRIAARVGDLWAG
ncbi:patatin-like phospholipase family protein [Phycicoccus sp. BSK3Z-2]|uniref:Patatin-like phospholipase family protein n=1 Tax=Phycicoccus avicenniae TaxID=2828860 RepID=A0A941DDL5_9MICO|nr:patatin-like phospholipase family protein [Phycicoccus avicenniae]MBR7744387.1 patatin-like phospholipase family protein [Phycicoccus avicenniae]